jgi:hypothetical protein
VLDVASFNAVMERLSQAVPQAFPPAGHVRASAVTGADLRGILRDYS